ncbi:MAG: L,D-transpeptidase [Mycolicibacterium insubricum]|nr:L,D-transpeptidase [Mycobacterium sp.]
MRRPVRMALTLLTALLLAMLNTAAVGSASVASDTGATVVRVQPATGSTVGVAHPVIVTFAAPVAESARAGVESTIKITAPANPTGSFEWLDDHTVQFVPTEFWPAHSQITGSVGAVPLNFETGAAVLGVASISKHTFTVSIDGAVARTMPASMGKPKHPTPVGSFTVLEKQNPVVMDSRTIGIPLNDPEGYKLTVNYAVRITWGGVYVHSAPWSVGQQGYSNVSHGCINISPDNAAWYYNTVGVGDPVIVNA